MYAWKDGEKTKNNQHSEYSKMILRIFDVFFEDILKSVTDGCSDPTCFGLKHLDKSMELFVTFSNEKNQCFGPDHGISNQ